jgi:hypothetical protein
LDDTAVLEAIAAELQTGGLDEAADESPQATVKGGSPAARRTATLLGGSPEDRLELAREGLDRWTARLADLESPEAGTDGERYAARNAILRFNQLSELALSDLAEANGDDLATGNHRTEATRLRDKLILGNQGAAHQVARMFTRSANAAGHAADVQQTALTELVARVAHWDPDRSTLPHAVRVYVSKAVKQEVTFHENPQLSYSQFTARSAVRKAETQLLGDGARHVTNAQLAEITGLPINLVAATRSHKPTSLDTPVGDDGSATLADMIDMESITGSADPTDDMWLVWYKKTVVGLTPKQRFLVIKRGGLDGGHRPAITAYGGDVGLGREHARTQLAAADSGLGASAAGLFMRPE